MKTYLFTTNLAIVLLICTLTNCQLKAQSTFDFEDVQKLREVILHQDSLFWKTYNTCDLDKLQTFFTEDLEFYHDKGGLTTTLSSFMESMKNGICSDENRRLRREVVEGSLEIYPIPGYGALLTGEHVFYVKEKDKKERLAARAKFLHIWRFNNNKWKMSRVISYEHKPSEHESQKKAITLPVETLKQFSGNYESPKKGTVTIALDANHLSLRSGNFQATLYPENEDTFFIKERDVQFKFIKDTNTGALKMTVIENSEVVDEAIKIN